METHHIFVPLLDIGELMPFGVNANNLKVKIDEEAINKNLIGFIRKLEKKLKLRIYYIGFDIIGERFYERFMFEKGGFLEIMMEAPVALNAHFTNKKSAESFVKALKSALHAVLPNNPVTRMLIESICTKDENDTSLTVEKWHKIKGIR